MQIIVVCALLVQVMGMWPALAGLLTTLVLMPASSFLGRRLAKARKAIVGHTDARIKLTTEVLTAFLYPNLACFTSTSRFVRISLLQSSSRVHDQITLLLRALKTAKDEVKARILSQVSV